MGDDWGDMHDAVATDTHPSNADQHDGYYHDVGHHASLTDDGWSAHSANGHDSTGHDNHLGGAIDVGPEQVVGDPTGSEAVWHEQTRPDTCAIASQEFVLDELTGVNHSEAELTAVAMDHGWYTPGGGTPMQDVGNLLEAYGVPVHRETGAGLADLNDALANGDKCIVGVQAEEIWAHELNPDGPLTDYLGIPGQGADHAVEVTGVDYTDPAHPVVVLNDPGTPHGCGERVPLDAFMQAWQESGNYLVTAGPGGSDG